MGKLIDSYLEFWAAGQLIGLVGGLVAFTILVVALLVKIFCIWFSKEHEK